MGYILVLLKKYESYEVYPFEVDEYLKISWWFFQKLFHGMARKWIGIAFLWRNLKDCGEHMGFLWVILCLREKKCLDFVKKMRENKGKWSLECLLGILV